MYALQPKRSVAADTDTNSAIAADDNDEVRNGEIEFTRKGREKSGQ